MQDHYRSKTFYLAVDKIVKEMNFGFNSSDQDDLSVVGEVALCPSPSSEAVIVFSYMSQATVGFNENYWKLIKLF